ncbi:hypothetical protein HOY34_20510 [Xinfangfangia sp. D13-10-4-6]|uniref:hypothetical protein n=1 Tax=Pseudogemmobacter hezensis TaxID=2737662 RepID=UPI0015542F71|nr:hypothetical protein [Pseudogemmobacter hezensis]NPD17571.1 hypothetical protein [Pseudogemmobacter hezensis]
MSSDPDYRRARRGKPINRGKAVSEAEFRRLWQDPTLTLRQIGERLDIHQATVSQRAKTRGLPPRKEIMPMIRHHRKITDPGLCIDMLRFGVSVGEICAYFKIKRSSLKSFRERAGEPGRKRGIHPSTSRTLAEFVIARTEAQMALGLATLAAAENRAVAGVWRRAA